MEYLRVREERFSETNGVFCLSFPRICTILRKHVHLPSLSHTTTLQSRGLYPTPFLSVVAMAIRAFVTDTFLRQNRQTGACRALRGL